MAFSDKPCINRAYSGQSEAHKVWREIDEIARMGEAMSSLRGSSVELRAQCNVRKEELEKRIESLKSRVKKLPARFSMINQAYADLPQCVSCGQSATYYCRSSDKLLKTAANELH